MKAPIVKVSILHNEETKRCFRDEMPPNQRTRESREVDTDVQPRTMSNFFSFAAERMGEGQAPDIAA